MDQRCHIETREAPDVAPHPSRFRVQVKKHKLVGMVLHELLFEYRGHPKVALSRPCVYGVFGRIVGGLAPKHELCVGCLRPPSIRRWCRSSPTRRAGNWEIPSSLRIWSTRSSPNPAAARCRCAAQGIAAVSAARAGTACGPTCRRSSVPPATGIHGREFISTAVDLGGRPAYLRFGERGEPLDPLPQVLSLPIPFLFDLPPASLRTPALEPEAPRLIELAGWNRQSYAELTERFPAA